MILASSYCGEQMGLPRFARNDEHNARNDEGMADDK